MVSLPMLAALSRLTMNEREAFLDRELCGRGDTAIGKTMGVSKARVYLLRQSAMSKLATDGRLIPYRPEG